MEEEGPESGRRRKVKRQVSNEATQHSGTAQQQNIKSPNHQRNKKA
jgi:hypothetical protein